MAEQQRKSKSSEKKETQNEEELKSANADTSKAAIKDELDDLLDEIDDVLETNAEEFVKNYVQKGGE
ncbi:MAG: ubiquitin-like protein Pup [Acidimicrobiia bacterium]